MLALALLMLLARGLYSINSELASEHFGQKLDKMKNVYLRTKPLLLKDFVILDLIVNALQ